MCQFKSGIILKNKIVVAPGKDDSHSNLLESLGIQDDYIGASKTFVRAELVPKNNEWWISPEEHPEKWTFIVDQDIVPDWFCREESEKEFRAAVCEWWKSHVPVDQKLEKLESGYYRLKRCEVKKLLNDVMADLYDSEVGVMLENSRVGVMLENSQVGEMRENSQVGEMLESSQVGEMWGSSRVGVMLESSQVGEMRENSRVGVMLENSQVGVMLESSQVGEMWGSSRVGVMRENSRVGVMLENSQVGEMRESSQVGEMWGSSRVGVMLENSRVGVMRESSQVGEMWGSSIAKDYKNYPKIKIWVSPEGNFEMLTYVNKTE